MSTAVVDNRLWQRLWWPWQHEGAASAMATALATATPAPHPTATNNGVVRAAALTVATIGVGICKCERAWLATSCIRMSVIDTAASASAPASASA